VYKVITFCIIIYTSLVLHNLTICCFKPRETRVQKNVFFLKKTQPSGFFGFTGFWALLVFQIFLFERALGKLVGWFSSSAKLLFRFTSTLDYLKIRNFITYWSLEAAKHEEIFNYYWHKKLKLHWVWCYFLWVFQRLLTENWWVFWVLPRCLNSAWNTH